MTGTPAQRAFHELGYGKEERPNGLPKLEYLHSHDPQLFRAIVDHCKRASDEEKESWRHWFRTYPARSHMSGSPDDGHLEAFRSRYHLAPLAVKVAHAAMNGSNLAVETLIGSSWQYMDRTGTGWDGAKAFMIVITLMPSMGKDSEKQKTEKIRYVKEHLAEVEKIIDEIASQGITSLDMLRRRLERDSDSDDLSGDDATLEA